MVSANTVGTTFWATMILGIKEGSLDGKGRGTLGEIKERFEYDGVAKHSERVNFESGLWDIGLQGGTLGFQGWNSMRS